MAGLSLSALRVFGREPPERAIVNLPFFSIESFCAFRMNDSRERARVSVEEKE
jgi:hypothetical protein